MYSAAPLQAHSSKEQVAELVAPQKDTLELVSSWLEHNGVYSSTISMTHGGNWLTASDVHISKANDLGASYNKSYKHYRHTAANLNSTVLHRSATRGLPEELHTHVQTVVPTTYFGSPRTPWHTPRTRNDSPRADTPEKEASGELVKTCKTSESGYAPAAAGRNAVGVAEPGRLEVVHERISPPQGRFGLRCRPDQGRRVRSKQPRFVAKRQHPVQCGHDVPNPAHLLQHGGTGNVQEVLVDWLNYLTMQQRTPQTISLSYGTYGHSIPPNLVNAEGQPILGFNVFATEILVQTAICER